jgi:hypothetical protein
VFAADSGPPEPEAGPPGSATDRDWDALMFIALHGAVLADQVKVVLDTDELSVHELLVGLAAAGMVKHQRAFHGHPGVFGITRRGLALIASDLPVPHAASRSYQHDIDVVWIWLAVRAGSFGPFEQFLSRREMRSRDAQPEHLADHRPAQGALLAVDEADDEGELPDEADGERDDQGLHERCRAAEAVGEPRRHDPAEQAHRHGRRGPDAGDAAGGELADRPRDRALLRASIGHGG